MTTPAPTDHSECRHCGRPILFSETDGWVDPLATGDDSIWRETCDAHDTFTAEHEPPIDVLSVTVARERDGTDCTEDDSAAIKRAMRDPGTDPAFRERLAVAWPLEWAEIGEES